MSIEGLSWRTLISSIHDWRKPNAQEPSTTSDLASEVATQVLKKQEEVKNSISKELVAASENTAPSAPKLSAAGKSPRSKADETGALSKRPRSQSTASENPPPSEAIGTEIPLPAAGKTPRSKDHEIPLSAAGRSRSHSTASSTEQAASSTEQRESPEAARKAEKNLLNEWSELEKKKTAFVKRLLQNKGINPNFDEFRFIEKTDPKSGTYLQYVRISYWSAPLIVDVGSDGIPHSDTRSLDIELNEQEKQELDKLSLEQFLLPPVPNCVYLKSPKCLYYHQDANGVWQLRWSPDIRVVTIEKFEKKHR